MREYLEKSGLTLGDIDRVIGTTQGIFGHEWLQDLIDNRRDTLPIVQHPIMNGCSSGSFQYLMELLELCTCMVAFKDDKELYKIISPLKVLSSYGDNLFQLAIAYRFKRLGFTTTLEPSISNGLLGDFEATKNEIRIMAECTVLREWGVKEEEEKVFWECEEKLKKLYKNGADQIVIDVVTKNALTFKTLENLRDDILKVATEFFKTNQTSKICNNEYDISIYAMDFDTKSKLDADPRVYFKNTGYDHCLSFSLISMRVSGDITSVLGASAPTSILKYKNLSPPEDPLEDRINKKILGKVKQLKSHPTTHKSILFVDVEDKLEDVDIERVGKRLTNSIFKQIPSLNAVMVTKRTWTGLGYQYQGTLLANPGNPLNHDLFMEFNTLERDIDFVQEWRSVFLPGDK